MPKRATVRFVGGPRHNELIDVEQRDLIAIAVPSVCATKFISHIDCEPHWVGECYYLATFVSEHGTLYEQYVHESLLDGEGGTLDCTWSETFPKWSLDKRKIDRRLSRAIHEND